MVIENWGKRMKNSVPFLLVAVMALCAGLVVAQEEMKGPEPEVPEVFVIPGHYVQIAFNNEGWVTLGYRMANYSQGRDWMLLEVGVTVRKPAQDQSVTRDSFSLTLPDESTIGLASEKSVWTTGRVPAIQLPRNMNRDSIDYFPVEAKQLCALRFFSGGPTAESLPRAHPYDQIDLSWQRVCTGDLFFVVPGGITTGQYWLNVRFADSVVRVPFRIMTREEQKYQRKNWQDPKKEYEALLKQEAEMAKAQQQETTDG